MWLPFRVSCIKYYTMAKTRLHTIITLTFLLDFIVCIKYSLSFIGQILDVLLILAMFGSAFLVIFTSYKSLSKLLRFYYGIYPVYLLLVVFFMLLRGGLLLVVLLIPFWPFVPQHNFVESPTLQIRASGAPLGSANYTLYKRYVLFEKQVCRPISAGESFSGRHSWKQIAIKNENKDSVNVSVNIDNKDTVLTFYK